MLNIRTHTFYLKNLEKSHPLKKLYSKKCKKKDVKEFIKWKKNIKYNYPTNVKIIFD